MTEKPNRKPKSKITDKERSLAVVGLNALIDEATGYQRVRPKDDLWKTYLARLKGDLVQWSDSRLQQIYLANLTGEFAEWSKKFPERFFLDLRRIFGWSDDEFDSSRKTQLNEFLNQYFYQKLSSEALSQLKQLDPNNGTLSDIPELHKLVIVISTVLAVSDDLDQFLEYSKRVKTINRDRS